MLFPEINDIYFSKTREYMKEVMESYSIGNYRAATVLLYSVVICDIMLKLQELIDMYNDTVAKEILSNINKIREDSSLSKSKWEKELLDKVHKRTDLLNDYSYINLCHLFDHRNFCAHPALNEDFELFSPNQEVVIAHIKNVLLDVLVKPPIFIKNIVEYMSNDLETKLEIYNNDEGALKTYLDNKYYSKMSASMVKKVFKALWKFCFFIDDDDHCKKNRKINRYAISILYDENKNELSDYVNKEKDKLIISNDLDCIGQLSVLLAKNCELYIALSDEVKHQIDVAIKNSDNLKAISWFKRKNLQEHIDYLCQQNSINLSSGCIGFMVDQFRKHGLLSILFDFFIQYFGNSKSFDDADDRYNYVIQPHLSEFSKNQFISIISCINSNNQIYNRRANKSCNTEIVKYAINILSDFDYDKYPYFEFYKSILESDSELKKSQEPDTFLNI